MSMSPRSVAKTVMPMNPKMQAVLDMVPSDWALIPKYTPPSSITALLDRGKIEVREHKALREWRRRYR